MSRFATDDSKTFRKTEISFAYPSSFRKTVLYYMMFRPTLTIDDRLLHLPAGSKQAVVNHAKLPDLEDKRVRLIIRCGLLGYLAALSCACLVIFFAGKSFASEGLITPAWIRFVTNAFILTPAGLIAGLIVGSILVLKRKKSSRAAQEIRQSD